VPLFYERRADNIPREWVRRMKRSINTAVSTFSTFRMVRDYYEKYYSRASEMWRKVNVGNLDHARELWKWKMKLYSSWAQVRVEEVVADRNDRLLAGSRMQLKARVHLNPIVPEDVEVQAYYGALNDQGQIVEGAVVPLECKGTIDGGAYQYGGAVPCSKTGRFGYEIRVLAKERHHDHAIHPVSDHVGLRGRN